MFTDEDKWIPIAIGHLSNSGNQNKSIQKCSIVMVSNFGFITRSILLLSFQEVTTYSSGGIRKIIENQKGRLNWVKKNNDNGGVRNCFYIKPFNEKYIYLINNIKLA